MATYRKGLIPQSPHLWTPAPGYGWYGAKDEDANAKPSTLQSTKWEAADTRLSDCEVMAAWYDMHKAARKAWKKLPKDKKTSRKGWKYVVLMREYRRQGKAAWKQCAQAAADAEAAAGAAEVAIEMSDDGMFATPIDEPLVSTEGPNYLLWGGVAAAGLGLLMLLRR
jgi:hypothetical protein